jgi:hypothetical protein
MQVSRKKRLYSKNTRRVQRGGAKFNFAYTFLAIGSADLEGKDAFIAYIKAQSQRCTCLEDRVPGCDADTGPLIGPGQILAIAIKYDAYSLVVADPNKLNDADIQAAILGHAVLAKHAGSSLVGIYGICSHRASTAEKSYGSVLLNILLTGIRLMRHETPIGGYWLGINLNNPSLTKLVHLYTSFGFKHPFVTSIDPFGNTLPFYFLMLTNINQEHVTFEGETRITFNKSMDIIHHLREVIRAPDYIPKMTFNIDKSAILSLRLFPYLGINGIRPRQERETQREYSGAFKIYSSTIVDNKVIYTISNDADPESRMIRYIEGNEEHADLPEDKSYSFHSHPISLYIKYNVCIGTPSGKDIYYLLYSSLKYLGRFAMIAAIEGLYIISLSETFLKSFLTREDINTKIAAVVANKDAIVDDMEFPFARRHYDWATHVDGDPDRTVVDAKIREYLDFINRKGIVEVQIIRWADLTKTKNITISYPFVYLNAFADAVDSEIIYATYPGLAVDSPAKHSRGRIPDIRARVPRFIERGNRA